MKSFRGANKENSTFNDFVKTVNDVYYDEYNEDCNIDKFLLLQYYNKGYTAIKTVLKIKFDEK